MKGRLVRPDRHSLIWPVGRAQDQHPRLLARCQAVPQPEEVRASAGGVNVWF